MSVTYTLLQSMRSAGQTKAATKHAHVGQMQETNNRKGRHFVAKGEDRVRQTECAQQHAINNTTKATKKRNRRYVNSSELVSMLGEQQHQTKDIAGKVCHGLEFH